MTTEDDAGTAADLAGQAWRALTAGDEAAAVPLARAAVVAACGRPRQERQRVQIVELAVAGDTVRATGLIAEHLAEYPADALVCQVLAWTSRDNRRSG